MKQKYKVEITKIVDGKKTEYLVGDVKDLDELVDNIEDFVERMRPISIDKEIEEFVDKMLKKVALATN